MKKGADIMVNLPLKILARNAIVRGFCYTIGVNAANAVVRKSMELKRKHDEKKQQKENCDI